jgi:uncharacterized Zn-finger protein
MNEQEVFKTHDEIMALEKQGVIGKSLREPLKPKLQSKPITPQTDLARTCYKLWRQFDLEGKPDNFNFTPHITAINEKYNALYQEQPKEQPLDEGLRLEIARELCRNFSRKVIWENLDTYSQCSFLVFASELILKIRQYYDVFLAADKSTGDALDKAKETEIAKLQARIKEIKSHTWCAYCAYCGTEYSLDTSAEIIGEHIKTCTKHPLYKANAEIAKLQAEIANMKSHTYCVYCGTEYLVDNDAGTKVTEHIRTCTKHPLYQALARIKELEVMVRELEYTLKER